MRVWDQWEESSRRQVLGSWQTCSRKISVSNVEPWEACHCLIWAIGTADIYPSLKRDTEAENHQSVEKQVLQVCSQCVFESEASVVVWEAVWHVVFLIFGGQVWLHCFDDDDDLCVCVCVCMCVCVCVCVCVVCVCVFPADQAKERCQQAPAESATKKGTEGRVRFKIISVGPTFAENACLW